MGTVDLDWGGSQRELLLGRDICAETSKIGRNEQGEG